MARYGCGLTPTTRYVILDPDGSPVTVPYSGDVLVYAPFKNGWAGCQNAYTLAAIDASKLGGEVVALVHSTSGSHDNR